MIQKKVTTIQTEHDDLSTLTDHSRSQRNWQGTWSQFRARKFEFHEGQGVSFKLFNSLFQILTIEIPVCIIHVVLSGMVFGRNATDKTPCMK